MDDLSKRLQVALRERKFSQSDLARALHVERASVNAWVKGNTKNLKMENLFGAARALGIRPEWLALGEAPMEQPPVSAEDRELLDLVAHMDDERRAETLRYARYARTISFTGNGEHRSTVQRTMVAKTPHEPPQKRKHKAPG